MKKVYLVRSLDTREENPSSTIYEVFTNKKLAEAYIKYWQKAHEERNYPYIVWLEEKEVCKCDYTSLVKLI